MTQILWSIYIAASFLLAPVGAQVKGDQVPPPYPIVDVHVPEGRVGLLDKQMLAAEQQEKMSKLNNIEHRLGVEHDILTTSLGDLSAKIQQTASLAEATINMLGASFHKSIEQ